MLRRPRRLRSGDRIAAVSLSWGGPGAHPHRYEAGKRQLETAFGVEVVEMPHTTAAPELLEADPAARADDLHRAFADPGIAGVVSTIGGEDSIRLLPHLDLDLISSHPKVFLGYSDATITHMALRRAGLVSFYGPAVMAGFAENAGMHEYLVDGVRRMLFAPQAPIEWPPNADGWTTEFTDWDDPRAQDRPRRLASSSGWRWHGGRPAEGPTLAACLEVLASLLGTEWWPELDGAVLLLQTSEEQPPPEHLGRFLRTVALTGQLQRVAGIVLGRPGGFDLPVEDHAAYDDAVLQVVRNEQHLLGLPVVCNVDFGHTDPMWTIPQGVRVRIDPDGRRITFLEAGVT